MKTITVKSLADELNLTPCRIRQVCAQHNIGTLITSQMRLLTPQDAQRLRVLFSRMVKGRPRKSKKSVDNLSRVR